MFISKPKKMLVLMEYFILISVQENSNVATPVWSNASVKHLFVTRLMIAKTIAMRKTVLWTIVGKRNLPVIIVLILKLVLRAVVDLDSNWLMLPSVLISMNVHSTQIMDAHSCV